MFKEGIRQIYSISTFLIIMLFVGCGQESESDQDPPGEDESTKTEALETGSAILQTDNPLDPLNVYLVGFHPIKEKPSHQIEAHHFCRQVNEDFAQCVLFDGNTTEANLTGIEYIISEKLFESLPEEEKKYWHPHNYEILSGQLVAPGIPDEASEELMKGKINSYGKTWHTWNTGSPTQSGDDMPLGEARLAWSFNRDGEARPELIQHRDSTMDINTEEIREERQDFVPLTNPQRGVDFLQGEFPRPTESIPGVINKNSEAQKDTAEES